MARQAATAAAQAATTPRQPLGCVLADPSPQTGCGQIFLRALRSRLSVETFTSPVDLVGLEGHVEHLGVATVLLLLAATAAATHLGVVDELGVEVGEPGHVRVGGTGLVERRGLDALVVQGVAVGHTGAEASQLFVSDGSAWSTSARSATAPAGTSGAWRGDLDGGCVVTGERLGDGVADVTVSGSVVFAGV